jgi:drug/metabolite transporter (DMT)-like permease
MHSPKHVRACIWLLIGTGVWGLSFPVIKATGLVQQKIIPGMESEFFAAMLSFVRFGAAAVVVALFSFRTWGRMTRLEWEQGVGLGVFGGLGILFQMDGLTYTSASTSAFLTQLTCILIPLWVALYRRALPRAAVIVSCAMVMAGVAVLSRFDLSEFKMGRGELETLLAAVFFTGQILWLERRRYANNSVSHFTVIMFAIIALLSLPVAMATKPAGHGLFDGYYSMQVLALVGVVAIGCTLVAYTLMNVWQPHVTATEAGLIYCVEPLYASVFALYLPGWISQFAGINYANERVTQNLIIGGGLITVANVLIQIDAARQRRRLEQAAVVVRDMDRI